MTASGSARVEFTEETGATSQSMVGIRTIHAGGRVGGTLIPQGAGHGYTESGGMFANVTASGSARKRSMEETDAISESMVSVVISPGVGIGLF